MQGPFRGHSAQGREGDWTGSAGCAEPAGTLRNGLRSVWLEGLQQGRGDGENLVFCWGPGVALPPNPAGGDGKISPAVSKPLHLKFLDAVVTEEAVESLL